MRRWNSVKRLPITTLLFRILPQMEGRNTNSGTSHTNHVCWLHGETAATPAKTAKMARTRSGAVAILSPWPSRGARALLVTHRYHDNIVTNTTCTYEIIGLRVVFNRCWLNKSNGKSNADSPETMDILCDWYTVHRVEVRFGPEARFAVTATTTRFCCAGRWRASPGNTKLGANNKRMSIKIDKKLYGKKVWKKKCI